MKDSINLQHDSGHKANMYIKKIRKIQSITWLAIQLFFEGSCYAARSYFFSFSAENKLGASKATIFRTYLVELSKQFPIFFPKKWFFANSSKIN